MTDAYRTPQEMVSGAGWFVRDEPLTGEAIDAMTDEEAERRLEAERGRRPEIVDAIEDAVLAASPGAGAHRVLRELAEW